MAHDLHGEDAWSIKARMCGDAPNAAMVWTTGKGDRPISLLGRHAAVPDAVPDAVPIVVSAAVSGA